MQAPRYPAEPRGHLFVAKEKISHPFPEALTFIVVNSKLSGRGSLWTDALKSSLYGLFGNGSSPGKEKIYQTRHQPKDAKRNEQIHECL